MRIVIICQWFLPEFAPIGVILNELAQDLIARGHEVTIVTGFPNHPDGIVFNGYKKKLFSTEFIDGVKVVRCYLYTSPKKTFLRRLLNYISFAVTSFLATLKLKNQDILFVVSPPLSNGLIALALNKLKTLPYIFNVQDIYPDAAISTGVITNKSAIRLLKKIEKFVYNNSNGISVISPNFKVNLCNKGVPQDKVSVIYNWIDTNEIVPLSKDNGFSFKHGLKDRFVVLYSGTIGLISGAEIILECAKKLITHKDIVFLFVGEGVVKDGLQKQVQKFKLPNVKFLSFQPRKTLSQVQSSSDVSIVSLARGTGVTSVPSKVLGYMAAARPVIASVDSDSDTHVLIENAQCGICVGPGDSDALVQSILSFYYDRNKAKSMGENGRKFLIDNFHRTRITSQYEKLFTENV